MLVSYRLEHDISPRHRFPGSIESVARSLQLPARQSAHAGQCSENYHQRHCPTGQRHRDLGTVRSTSRAEDRSDAVERGPDADGRFQGPPVRSVQSPGDHTELPASRNVSGLLHLIDKFVAASKTLIETSIREGITRSSLFFDVFGLKNYFV